jgi:hypothetical protein
MSPTKTNDKDEHEPSTYFEIEQRRLDNPGEEKAAPTMPALPASSPWSAENVLPDELPIDRTEDAANGGLPDMTEVQQ